VEIDAIELIFPVRTYIARSGFLGISRGYFM
jgi:hypothetical protein